jgi:hypothetical protein
MTKTACMICGREPPFDFQITRERDKEADPDRKELEIHIKRNHSLEEMQKHLNPSEFNRKKKAKADQQQEQEQQEQEGEESINTDDIVAQLLKKEGISSSAAGGTRSSAARRSKSTTSRSRRSTRSTQKEPTVVVEKAEDASSADL